MAVLARKLPEVTGTEQEGVSLAMLVRSEQS